MRKRNDYLIMYYRCNSCGREFTIPRHKGSLRGKNHIKDLWCPWCKANTKFVEIGIW